MAISKPKIGRTEKAPCDGCDKVEKIKPKKSREKRSGSAILRLRRAVEGAGLEMPKRRIKKAVKKSASEARSTAPELTDKYGRKEGAVRKRYNNIKKEFYLQRLDSVSSGKLEWKDIPWDPSIAKIRTIAEGRKQLEETKRQMREDAQEKAAHLRHLDQIRSNPAYAKRNRARRSIAQKFGDGTRSAYVRPVSTVHYGSSGSYRRIQRPKTSYAGDQAKIPSEREVPKRSSPEIEALKREHEEHERRMLDLGVTKKQMEFMSSLLRSRSKDKIQYYFDKKGKLVVVDGMTKEGKLQVSIVKDSVEKSVVDRDSLAREHPRYEYKNGQWPPAPGSPQYIENKKWEFPDGEEIPADYISTSRSATSAPDFAPDERSPKEADPKPAPKESIPSEKAKPDTTRSARGPTPAEAPKPPEPEEESRKEKSVLKPTPAEAPKPPEPEEEPKEKKSESKKKEEKSAPKKAETTAKEKETEKKSPKEVEEAFKRLDGLKKTTDAKLMKLHEGMDKKWEKERGVLYVEIGENLDRESRLITTIGNTDGITSNQLSLLESRYNYILVHKRLLRSSLLSELNHNSPKDTQRKIYEDELSMLDAKYNQLSDNPTVRKQWEIRWDKLKEMIKAEYKEEDKPTAEEDPSPSEPKAEKVDEKKEAEKKSPKEEAFKKLDGLKKTTDAKLRKLHKGMGKKWSREMNLLYEEIGKDFYVEDNLIEKIGKMKGLTNAQNALLRSRYGYIIGNKLLLRRTRRSDQSSSSDMRSVYEAELKEFEHYREKIHLDNPGVGQQWDLRYERLKKMVEDMQEEEEKPTPKKAEKTDEKKETEKKSPKEIEKTLEKLNKLGRETDASLIELHDSMDETFGDDRRDLYKKVLDNLVIEDIELRPIFMSDMNGMNEKQKKFITDRYSYLATNQGLFRANVLSELSKLHSKENRGEIYKDERDMIEGHQMVLGHNRKVLGKWLKRWAKLTDMISDLQEEEDKPTPAEKPSDVSEEEKKPQEDDLTSAQEKTDDFLENQSDDSDAREGLRIVSEEMKILEKKKESIKKGNNDNDQSEAVDALEKRYEKLDQYTTKLLEQVRRQAREKSQ